MPVNFEDVLKLLCQLSDEADLKVSLKETAKGGIIAGCSTVAGGLLLGPVGMAVGGAVGGAVAAYTSWGKFKPVSSILMDMEQEKKEMLYNKAKDILGNLGPQELVALSTFVIANPLIKQQLVGAVVDHVHNQLKMEIID